MEEKSVELGTPLGSYCQFGLRNHYGRRKGKAFPDCHWPPEYSLWALQKVGKHDRSRAKATLNSTPHFQAKVWRRNGNGGGNYQSDPTLENKKCAQWYSETQVNS